MRKSHHLVRGGKRIALLLCMTLVWMSVTPASQVTAEGATLSQLKDKQNQLQQEKEENQEKLNELKESEEEQEEYVAALQDQIGNLQGQIDTLNAQVDLLNEEIREKEDAIADKQNQIDTDMNQLKKRLRALYMAGDASTLAILLHAENIEDLARKSEVIKSIARHDNELISSLKEELDAVADEKAAIEKDKKEVTQSKNSLDEQRKELADLEEEAKETLAEIQGKKNQVQNTLDSLEGEMADAENAIDQWYRDYYSSQNGSSNSGNSNQGSGSYSGSMTWPVPGYSGCIYQGFSSSHKGYDISGGGIYGAPIVAAASGRVIFAAFGTAYNSHNRYGYCVDIDHGSGIATRYAHCSALTVSAGDYVTAGQIIGYVGSTGQSTGAHLHFEVRKNGVAVNPAGYL